MGRRGRPSSRLSTSLCAAAANEFPNDTKCDGCHRLDVSYLTQTQGPMAVEDTGNPITHGYIRDWRRGMLVRTFVHLSAQAIVVAIALTLALPFFLAVSSPFVGR